MDAPQHKLPDDPLAFIQACVRKQALFWTYHVNMCLQHRSIARQAILDAVDTYEIIEAYLIRLSNMYFIDITLFI
jgi:hypothetical protein